MKKTLAILLCMALFLAALPGPVSAEPEELTKQEAIIREARRVYNYSLSSAGKESFAGFCGLMTSHQLWHMGINDWCVTNDGKKQFDYYSALEVTSGGYYINAFPAGEYSLEETLNTITRYGTRDAYDILVGFEWTNTEAGNIYGHACVINAILDGTVYFVESFYTSLGGAEGRVIQCSISEFAAYFSDWTVFDGVIHFVKNYADCCQGYGTDVYLQTRFESILRSQPCLVGSNGCTRLRSIAPGERLYATALVENTDKELYYRIDDGERTGYVAASAVGVLQVSGEDLRLQDVNIPAALEVGQDMEISGIASAANACVGAVEVCVTDAMDNIVLRERANSGLIRQDISCLNGVLSFDLLEQGAYTVEIFADAASVIARGDKLATVYERMELWKQTLQVGENSTAGIMTETAMAEPVLRDGWFCKAGTWYCYKQGKPCTGWVSACGVDYYLDETGAVTTGWQEIDGWLHYFSGTGAMCTGWLTTDSGTMYLLSDGTAATLWQDIGTGRYCFTEEGILMTGCQITDGDTVYVIDEEGRAKPTTDG